jgi:hypothetical protein
VRDWPSAEAAIKTKYHSMLSARNDLRAPTPKLQSQYSKLCSKGQPRPSH